MKTNLLTMMTMLAATAVAGPALPLLPYTLAGRAVDGLHQAYDGDYSLTLTASKADGACLAETKTYRDASSRTNYRLEIPVSDVARDRQARVGDMLIISASDAYGETWVGVVADARVTGAGALRDVDLVLMVDDDGDGVDDLMYEVLDEMWRESEFYSAARDGGKAFEPSADHDGDGVSTLKEVFAGTDPFDPLDTFKIVAFDAGRKGEDGKASPALAFPTRQGKIYYLEACTSLENGDWKRIAFSVSEDGVPISLLNAAEDSRRSTVFLTPTEYRFFRVVGE